MAGSTTITIRVPAETKNALDRLADRTKRTRSFLAGEAVADYVTRELAIVESIGRGLADMREGRLVRHDAAMTRLRKAMASRG
jgi:predicted transcriptional regulator